jgi:hypothetical protein
VASTPPCLSLSTQAVRCRRNRGQAKKPKKGKQAKPESAIAKAKLKAGRSKLVSLKPTKAAAKKLAAAKSVLVKETVKIGASTKTRVAKLKIVQ